MVKRFVKYNPAFLEGDELIENFVVRLIDFRMIIRIIRENSVASNQHVLVIGPRGSGKTTLVRRIALEVERDEELDKACYPLIFAEESYNAVSAADFWLEALFHLAEQTGEAHKMRTYQELRRDPDEQRIGERALWELLDFADKIGKRILLVVENLDMLLSEFSDKQEAWKLRHTLMNEPRLMLLATAIGRSEAIDHPAHAMFELFKIHELNALDDQECNTIWELVAGDKLPGEQIRPVRILTGGNARLIALIAKFGARRSFRQLLDDLIDLIDEHTDYFKSHLDAMASKERKVYLALAELWSLSTAKEVAEVARLDVNTASALLSRLVSRGKVVFEDNGKRTKWYRISEGIYNIYYLMRRRGSPSARVNAAVKFMVSLYDPVSAARMLIDETSVLLPEQCRDHYVAFEEVIKNISDQKVLQRIGLATPKIFLDSPYLSEIVKKRLISEGAMSLYEVGEDADMDFKTIKEVLENAHNCFKIKDYVKAIQLLEEVTDKYKSRPEVEIVEQIAIAILNKGLVLDRLNRKGEAIQSYEECVALYGCRSEVDIATLIARALNNKAAILWDSRCEDKAVLACKELIANYKDRSEVIIAEQVARAMFNNGIILTHLNRKDEAIQSYEELIGLYRNRNEVDIATLIARALNNKAAILWDSRCEDKAVLACKELIANYKDRSEVIIAEQVARAMFNNGIILTHLNRKDEAIQSYEELIGLYRNRNEVEIAEWVMGGMYNKGIVLCILNREEEGLQTYEELIDLYNALPEKEISVWVARAMFDKGLVLGSLNREEEELQAYGEFIAMNKERAEMEIVVKVVNAMYIKGLIFSSRNCHEEATEVYEELIVKYNDRQENEIVEKVARAMFQKGWSLGSLKRVDDAIEAYNELIVKYSDYPEKEIVEWVAKAMLDKGITLAQLARYQEAEPVFVQAIEQAPLMWEAYVEFVKLLLKLPERQDDALDLARKYVDTLGLVEQSIDGAIAMFVELAASGYAREALGLLVDSPAEPHLEPLVVALRMYIGEEVRSAVEIQEVAKDVVKRIEARQHAMKSSDAHSPASSL